MFEALRFRKKLRDLNFSNFEELEAELIEKSKLKRKLADIENEYTIKINELETAYRKEISQKQDEFEREIGRLKVEHLNTLSTINHKIELKEKEFELEKQKMLTDANEQINRERASFLEKNYGSLQEGLDRNFEQTQKMIETVSKFVPNYRNDRYEGNVPQLTKLEIKNE